jgi:hypothetical protein
MKCPSCFSLMAPGDEICNTCQTPVGGGDRTGAWTDEDQGRKDYAGHFAVLCWVLGGLCTQSGGAGAFLIGFVSGFLCLAVPYARSLSVNVRVFILSVITIICLIGALAFALN